MAKGYTIRVQRYRFYKNWICGKDSIPLILFYFPRSNNWESWFNLMKKISDWKTRIYYKGTKYMSNTDIFKISISFQTIFNIDVLFPRVNKHNFRLADLKITIFLASKVSNWSEGFSRLRPFLILKYNFRFYESNFKLRSKNNIFIGS